MDPKKLYYGDNLDIFKKHFRDKSIDLIYLDPPFQSGRKYNIIFAESDGKEPAAQLEAFEDTWRWDIESENTYCELIEKGPPGLSKLIEAMKVYLGPNAMMAYIVMMAVRLKELHRVLKNTGSIYLHCDPTASHYMKLVMDSIFAPKNFQNEVIWHYRRWTAAARRYQRMHDVILYYTKSDEYIFNKVFIEPTESQAGVIEKGYNVNKVNRGGKKVLQLLVYDQEKVDSLIDEGKIDLSNTGTLCTSPRGKRLRPTYGPIYNIYIPSLRRD